MFWLISVLLGPNHTYVKEYSLVGIEDPRGGERLGMLVVPDAEENGDLDRATLHSRAKETIDKAVEYGTHTVFFCKALDISVSQATTCLIYQGRAYHKIEGFG